MLRKIVKGCAVLFALTAVFTGCSNDETEPTTASPDDSRLIRFTAGDGPAATRTSTAFDGATFQVMADHTTDNSTWAAYIPDVVATKSSSEWKTATSYYMPTAGTLKFYAYNSGSYTATHTAGTAPTITVTDMKTSKDDLLVAGPIDVAYTASGTVAVEFSHAMAAVWFSGVTDGTISIAGLSNSGTYTIGTGWGSLGTANTAYADLPLTGVGAITQNSPLLLIPQVLTGKTLTYSFTEGLTPVSLTTTLPTLSLEAGKRYELQLNTTTMTVTVSISPWSNGGTDSDTIIL